MFYSRSLLARKAPLGQIWMAATTHGKINRKKLYKLNIIKICEEILNPSVPMALRLSGILMGGVVIVYERKVKLLYNDVNRLLVEINQAWKVKSVPDPTLLPKGKSQAKYEAITLPAIREEDIEEMETLQHSDATTGMGFTQTAYFPMRLDNMDNSYINLNPKEDLPQDYHQANADDITMLESYDPSLEDTSMYNRFERFDIEGDNDTQLNFTAPEHTTIPSTLVPSPPPQCDPQADEILEQNPEGQVQQVANGNEIFPDQRRQGPTRARRPPTFAMDNDQTIIPGHIFQSWLQDTSDIASRKRNKKQSDATLKRKIANLMDLPPTVLFDGLFTSGNREVHFPAPLLELWRKSSQPLHGSPSVRTSTCQHLETSRTSPPEGIHDQYPLEHPFEDFHSGAGSQTVGDSIETLRSNRNNNNIESEIQRVEFAANNRNTEVPLPEAYGVNISKTDMMATPGNSSDEVRSIPSSGSGHGLPLNNSEINSARSNKKRTFSSSSLEPVSEENSGQQDFKLARLSENELMVETGPTQTQKYEPTNQPADHITDSIKMQLKAHFEKPGSPKVESLKQLARGMDRRKAAILFYQTCVLATKDSIKVHQKEPYGDILISTGPNM